MVTAKDVDVDNTAQLITIEGIAGDSPLTNYRHTLDVTRQSPLQVVSPGRLAPLHVVEIAVSRPTIVLFDALVNGTDLGPVELLSVTTMENVTLRRMIELSGVTVEAIMIRDTRMLLALRFASAVEHYYAPGGGEPRLTTYLSDPSVEVVANFERGSAQLGVGHFIKTAVDGSLTTPAAYVGWSSLSDGYLMATRVEGVPVMRVRIVKQTYDAVTGFLFGAAVDAQAIPLEWRVVRNSGSPVLVQPHIQVVSSLARPVTAIAPAYLIDDIVELELDDLILTFRTLNSTGTVTGTSQFVWPSP